VKPFQAPGDPELWVATAKRLGYRAVSWPLGRAETAELVRDYLAAAAAVDLIIAEVGAWSNPLCQYRGLTWRAVGRAAP
jgi:hypothetical protein